MQLSEAFAGLGEERFRQMMQSISIGKLKTFQLYERMKARAHLAKLNTENLRKAAPRLWARVQENDDELAQDLAQSVLISHLPMITSVLDFLGIPHEEGFFAKDVDAGKYLTNGWQQRTFDKFKGEHPEAVLVFYLNHLAWEFEKEAPLFMPGEAAGGQEG